MSVELESEAYADNAVLMELFGDTPKVRIVVALLSEPQPGYDYNISELAELAGVSRNTVYRHLPDLAEINVVQKTRTSGTDRYELNRDHPVIESIEKLQWDLARYLHSSDGSGGTDE